MSFRVLIVEDDQRWRSALWNMYTEILKGGDQAIVMTASSGQDAIELLEREKFDLLSLDINLAQTHPFAPDGTVNRRIPGADGRDVLRVAAEKGACHAVVIITGMQQDQSLRLIIPVEDQRVELRMSLDSYLFDIFQGKNLILNKNLESAVEDSTSKIKKALTLERLLKLCGRERAVNEFRCEGDFWFIRFQSKGVRLKDTKGLHYIAYLLQSKGGISSLQLQQWYDKTTVSIKRGDLSDLYGPEIGGEEKVGLPNGRILLTKDDKYEMITRIKEYDVELGRLESTGLRESGEAEFIRNEIKKIQRDLGALEDPESFYKQTHERSRQTVSRAIHFTLKKIKEYHPELWIHLRREPGASLHIGTLLEYRPASPQNWKVTFEPKSGAAE